MNPRGANLRLACIGPVFAYGVVMTLAHPVRWSVLSVAAVAALALPLVAILTPRFAGWIYAPAALVIGITAVAWLTHPVAASSPFADLAMGVLLGAPLGIFALVAERRASLPAVLLGLFAGLSSLQLGLATVRALPSATPAGPIAWSITAATILGAQLSSLSQWAAGSGVAPPPLGYVGDAWFDALVLLATSGILLSWLGFGARLELRGVDGASANPPPPGPGWTGVRSLVIAIGAILAFELGAVWNPVLAAEAAVVAVAVTSVVIARLVRPTAAPVPPPVTRPVAAAVAVGPAGPD